MQQVYGKPMWWFVEVTDVIGDHGLVSAVLERAGYAISAEDPPGLQTLLSHPKYEEFETANQVHADAKHLSETLRQFSELDGTAIGITIGAVQSRQADGTANKHIFAELRVTISVMTGSATGTVTRNPALTEEEHQRLITEAQAKAAMQKRLSIIHRACAALRRPRILEVMELMGIAAPSTTQLGHIVDLIQDECGGDMEKYASRKQLRRFNHSINHPEVFGLEARHAVSAEDPPSEPMDYAEVKAFAHNIGRLWLAEIERGT